jgi:hypothetical protein
MVIGSTMFDLNQIDHLLIDARHVSNLMDIRTYSGVNTDSDHYLIVSKIRGRMSNSRKLHGNYSKKFNCKRLKKPEIAASYVDRLDECLADWNDSENVSVSERWESLQNIITTTTAHSVLGKVDKVKYDYWFGAECEHVTTLKNRVYVRMEQRSHTQNAVEEYRLARREERRLHKKMK